MVTIMNLFKRYNSKTERNIGNIEESLDIINIFKKYINFSFIQGKC